MWGEAERSRLNISHLLPHPAEQSQSALASLGQVDAEFENAGARI
jgi:hypothetical protein